MSKDASAPDASPPGRSNTTRYGLLKRALLPLLIASMPYPALVDAAPCEDGFESTRCSKHADNDGGSLPPFPARGEMLPFNEFGTRAVRMTERGMFGSASARHHHQYSRRQAWNADETLLDLRGGIVNAADHSVVLYNPPLSSERNWSNSNPDLIYAIRHSPKPNELVAFSVKSGQYDVLFHFDQHEKCTIGEHEGNLSNDDRYVLIVCADSGNKRSLISFDIAERRVMGQTEARKDLNWASFTQSGRYVVVENNQPNTGLEQQLIRYSPDLTKSKVLTNDRNHGDLGIDKNGEDVFVMINRVRLSYIVISTGERVELGIANRSNPVGHGHVSCRNIHRPGWCFLSSYDGAFGAFRLDDSDGSDAFEQWGHHYSSSNSYDAQPKASASPSGRQAIFTTDWGGSQGCQRLRCQAERRRVAEGHWPGQHSEAPRPSVLMQ